MISWPRRAKRLFLTGNRVLDVEMSGQFIWTNSLNEGYNNTHNNVSGKNTMKLAFVWAVFFTKPRQNFKFFSIMLWFMKQAGVELGQAQPKLGPELGFLKFIFVALNWWTRMLIPILRLPPTTSCHLAWVAKTGKTRILIVLCYSVSKRSG